MSTEKKFSFSVPRCERQYWAEFLKAYDQHVNCLTGVKKLRVPGGVKTRLQQSRACTLSRTVASVFGRKSLDGSLKTPFAFAPISFRVLEEPTLLASSENKPRGIDRITSYFHQSIDTAATNLNTCATMLKRICRLHGLHRWPGRKVVSLRKKILATEGQLIAASHSKVMLRTKLNILKLEMANIMLLPY